MSLSAASLQPQAFVDSLARAVTRHWESALAAADSLDGFRPWEKPSTGQKAGGSPMARARGAGFERKSLPSGLKERNGTSAADTRLLSGREATLENVNRPAFRAVAVTSRSSFTEKFRPVGVIMIVGIALSVVRALSRAGLQPTAAVSVRASRAKADQEGLRWACSPDWIGTEASGHLRCELRLPNAVVRRTGMSNDSGK